MPRRVDLNNNTLAGCCLPFPSTCSVDDLTFQPYSPQSSECECECARACISLFAYLYCKFSWNIACAAMPFFKRSGGFLQGVWLIFKTPWVSYVTSTRIFFSSFETSVTLQQTIKTIVSEKVGSLHAILHSGCIARTGVQYRPIISECNEKKSCFFLTVIATTPMDSKKNCAYTHKQNRLHCLCR